jgi:hypothetical protein
MFAPYVLCTIFNLSVTRWGNDSLSALNNSLEGIVEILLYESNSDSTAKTSRLLSVVVEAEVIFLWC